MMSQQDIELVCRDCGQTFVFTAGEQEFYSQKGFLHTPVRCPECRQARKKSRADTKQNHERKHNTRSRLDKPSSGPKHPPH